MQQPYMVPGGAAPEMEVVHHLGQWGMGLAGMSSYAVREFAEALEVIPYTLAENAGLNPIHIVSQLRSMHASGEREVRPHLVCFRPGYVLRVRIEITTYCALGRRL